MRNIIDYFFSNLKVLSGLKQFNLNIARKKNMQFIQKWLQLVIKVGK